MVLRRATSTSTTTTGTRCGVAPTSLWTPEAIPTYTRGPACSGVPLKEVMVSWYAHHEEYHGVEGVSMVGMVP